MVSIIPDIYRHQVHIAQSTYCTQTFVIFYVYLQLYVMLRLSIAKHWESCPLNPLKKKNQPVSI